MINKNDYLKKISFGDSNSSMFSLIKFAESNKCELEKLPFSIRILLEQTIRHLDGFKVKDSDIINLSNWNGKATGKEIPYIPSRVVLQDFTGVPTLVDLASLRNYMEKAGKSPSKINPLVPVDLIIDHSVQVDYFGSKDALQQNLNMEFKRNRERYEFIKWGERAFNNFRVFPPGAGIIHQVNLEYLANVVEERDGVCFPDTLVGTDSHTTMINGLGVMGWGVGGIEAESAMLGQPIYMQIPQVVGLRMKGILNEGVTATDLVLTVTEMLRKKGVVEKFVEFFGPGLNELSLANRATIANMAPEYGATMGFFPVDEKTLEYLKNTGRNKEIINRVETYCKEQMLFRSANTPNPNFSDTLELDLSTVVPSMAGPKRPQDRIALQDMKKTWQGLLNKPVSEQGFNLNTEEQSAASPIKGIEAELKHGAVVIAAITSCTNTSNPSVMLSAGLMAKKAIEKGIKCKPWVKASVAPGSRVVTEYLDLTGLNEFLEKIGFYTVGYGCTTCIGNSGPLPENISESIRAKNLIVSSVLSGNRNFEGRVHGEVKSNFLASPPLVVAHALAGTVNIDLQNEPIAQGSNGEDVYLKDIWPTNEEVQNELNKIGAEIFTNTYGQIKGISKEWLDVKTPTSESYQWKDESTYIQNPPFFSGMSQQVSPIEDITDARVLLKLGDSVTTDHISPAGSFKPDTPAGKFLLEKGVPVEEFNSYGSRRGNDKIMMRGTFANIRIRNQLLKDVEGGFTKHFPTDSTMTVYDAAIDYKKREIPLIVLAGREYGTGSSRDWAAKGTFLLGVKAVIASSFERIHRSNLIGMGVLPLQFKDGKTHEDYGLTGEEVFSIKDLQNITPKQEISLVADAQKIPVLCRLDTLVEIEYYRNGGILHTVLRDFMKQ